MKNEIKVDLKALKDELIYLSSLIGKKQLERSHGIYIPMKEIRQLQKKFIDLSKRYYIYKTRF